MTTVNALMQRFQNLSFERNLVDHEEMDSILEEAKNLTPAEYVSFVEFLVDYFFSLIHNWKIEEKLGELPMSKLMEMGRG